VQAALPLPSFCQHFSAAQKNQKKKKKQKKPPPPVHQTSANTILIGRAAGSFLDCHVLTACLRPFAGQTEARNIAHSLLP